MNSAVKVGGRKLVEWRDVTVRFPSARTGGLGRKRVSVAAVDRVSLELHEGEMLAVVGESGSGKSTLLLAALGLAPLAEGTIAICGHDVASAPSRVQRGLRERIGVVFQDPYGALNPRHSVGVIVEEALRIHHRSLGSAERRERVTRALERARVVPPEAFLKRFPADLSGGQRQRVAIATSLVCEPNIVLADEPVSMLDVSVRNEILGLLASLRDEGVAVAMVTHDLVSAAHFADRIAVLYRGRVVEQGPPERVVAEPAHPYTRALLSVVPRRNRLRRDKPIILTGEITTEPPERGCCFFDRCYARLAECAEIEPALDAVGSESTHKAACLRKGEQHALASRIVRQHAH